MLDKKDITLITVIAIEALFALGLGYRHYKAEDLPSLFSHNPGYVTTFSCQNGWQNENGPEIRIAPENVKIRLENNLANIALSASISPQSDSYDTLQWESSDEAIATVDQNGFVTATAPGTVKIMAYTPDVAYWKEATVQVVQPVTGILLTTASAKVTVGDLSQKLSATIYPENATEQSVVWSCKDPEIATVDENGYITPKAPGMTEVTVTAKDGNFSAKGFITVVKNSVQAQNVMITNKPSQGIGAGKTYPLVALLEPPNARDKTLTWKSSDPEVATVSQTGKIKTVREGVTTIEVRTNNGVTDRFDLVVSAQTEANELDSIASVPTLTVESKMKYTPYIRPFPSVVRTQMQGSPPPKIYRGGGLVPATEAETAEYMNPNNYYTGAYKYQFLDLGKPNHVSEEALNAFLKDKGILKGQAAAFIKAANDYNISEVYLVAHACLETGGGTSTLARGVEYNGVTVYNMYGIGAYDNSAVSSGSKKAYSMGWTNVEAAIRGGAEWISEKYINSPQYHQNTLYKMLWNPEAPGQHQYATDIGWAVKQAVSIEKIFAQFPGASISFDIPVYSGMVPPSLSFE